MRSLRCCWLPLLVLCGSPVAAQNAAVQPAAALWSDGGKTWNRERLPDYSYAGYRAGEVALPKLPVVANVRSFGAVGDGLHDDTDAFRRAIAETHDGALLVPRGVYRLTSVLDINKSRFALRGEGSGEDGTVLSFEKSMTEMLGKHRWASGHGAVIWVGDRQNSADNAPDGNELPAFNGPVLATVTQPARRGDRTLKVKDVRHLSAGDYVVLGLTEDAARSLGRHLHNDQDQPGDSPARSSLEWFEQVKTVTSDTLELAQPLRGDVRLEWKPEIRAWFGVREVGIEHLRIRFPDTALRSHFGWFGNNGLFFDKALNSWANDVTVENGDNGIGLLDCKFVTLARTRLLSGKRAPEMATDALRGHHGWKISRSADCLLTDFEIDCQFIHDVTVHRCSGNVIRRGQGPNLALDHHRDAPFENLYTDIDTGSGQRVWKSSGERTRGPHAGARNTYWNIRGRSWTAPPAPPWGHIQANLIPAMTDSQTENREWLDLKKSIEPPDLYEAQSQTRLGDVRP